MSVSSAKAAELVKVFENTFRAVNIALVNELSMLCDRMDINIWEVLDAANTKPFGIMPFYPGPGVGGHCIPIDPHYLEWKTKELALLYLWWKLWIQKLKSRQGKYFSPLDLKAHLVCHHRSKRAPSVSLKVARSSIVKP